MPLTRRSTLALGVAAAAATLSRPSLARAAAPFMQPPLPYDEAALAPQISARTVGLHYGKHHKAYFDKLNTLVPNTPYADMDLEQVVKDSAAKDDRKVFNQAGQAWNHVHYWQQFAGGPAAPDGSFLEAVDRDFGRFESLMKAFAAQSDTVFGTGWVWLSEAGGKLVVKGYQDAGNPLMDGHKPLVGVDLWEHAYYLDYENRKAEHMTAVLSERVNWKAAGDRLAG